MKMLSFVIPCYGSEKTLHKVVEEILISIEKLDKYDYEIILVNDSSPDNVVDVIKHLCNGNCKIKGINLAKNFGQHSAMMAGFSKVSGDIIIDVDDDGQTPVFELPKLLDKINEGFDIVIGNQDKQNKRLYRKVGTFANDYMAKKLINKPDDIHFTSFVVMRRYVVDEICRYKNAYPYLAGLMLQSSNRICNVDIELRERFEGKSGYSFMKLLSLWVNGFTAFSVKPLRLATFIGLTFSVGGFFYAGYIILQRLINENVLAGYSSLMAGLLVIGGMNMMMLGLIGEYIGRMYISINNAPQYIIREEFNIND